MLGGIFISWIPDTAFQAVVYILLEVRICLVPHEALLKYIEDFLMRKSIDSIVHLFLHYLPVSLLTFRSAISIDYYYQKLTNHPYNRLLPFSMLTTIPNF